MEESRYSRAITGSFQFDDYWAIAKVPTEEHLSDLRRLPRFLLDEYLALGRPIMDVVLAIQYRLFGLSPVGYHAISIVMHLAAVVLAYFVVQELARRSGWTDGWLAPVVAGVFAVHPVQTEAASYIWQFAEVLASALYLAAFLLLVKAEDFGPRSRGVASWILAFAAFVLAQAAKPMAVTLPAAFLLTCACLPRERSDASKRPAWWPVLLASPFAALSVAITVRAMIVLRGQNNIGFGMPGRGPDVYFMTQWRVVLSYLRLLVWPSGQNVDHEFVMSAGLLEPPSTLLAGMALAGLAAAAIVLVLISRGRSGPGAAAARLAGFGFLWFLLILAPTSTVVPLADVLVEHRVYLALLGVALTASASAAWMVTHFTPRYASFVQRAGSVAVLASLAVATYCRNSVWISNEALWADSAAKAPGKARPHDNYAHALYLAGKVPQAVAEYRQALADVGDGTVPLIGVLRGLGGALLEVGRAEEAADVLHNAARVFPGDPEIQNDLAIWYLRSGDVFNARELADDVVQGSPDYPAIHNTIGEILLRDGDVHGALQHFQKARSVTHDPTVAAFVFAVFEQRLGMTADACEAWTEYARFAQTSSARDSALQRRKDLGCR